MKTTKKQFAEFEEACHKWIDFFGLKDWEVDIKHSRLPDEDTNSQVTRDYDAKYACVIFNTDLGNKFKDDDFKKVAFHEICHILLGELGDLAGRRFITPDELVNQEHTIVHRLCNSVYKHC